MDGWMETTVVSVFLVRIEKSLSLPPLLAVLFRNRVLNSFVQSVMSQRELAILPN